MRLFLRLLLCLALLTQVTAGAMASAPPCPAQDGGDMSMGSASASSDASLDNSGGHDCCGDDASTAMPGCDMDQHCPGAQLPLSCTNNLAQAPATKHSVFLPPSSTALSTLPSDLWRPPAIL